MVRWRLLDDPEPKPGAWNMALDEVLFRAAEEGRAEGPVLRLYAWSPACLSIGFHQALDETCDPAFCARAGYDVVRRSTGGKAVLHDDEVTYAVVGRHDLPPFAGLSLGQTYVLIAGGLRYALASLGLDVVLSERPSAVTPRGGAPCFLVPSEGEITVGGRKVVGSAQRRGARAFLQHGAVPLNLDYRALALSSGQSEASIPAYRRAFAGVAALNPSITREALRKALVEGFRRTFPEAWDDRPPNEAEASAAQVLARERFGAPWWTQNVPGGNAVGPGRERARAATRL